MTLSFTEQAGLFKALSDATRLEIFSIISKQELCACELLKNFSITQPTLSYHMKILMECGLIYGRKEGSWMHYSLNKDKFSSVQKILNNLL